MERIGQLNTLIERPWADWERRTASRRNILAKETDVKTDLVTVDFSRYTPDDYLLTWATAVAGVEVEEDGHTIVLPHCDLVNDNGNAWINDTLLENYNSFILAENYLEHVQKKELSKGKLLDAVAWVMRKKHPRYKHPIPTVFVDVLIATNKKKHPALCRKVLDGTLNAVSMGCDVVWTQCSRCGHKVKEGRDEACEHVADQLGESYKYKDGTKRITSELCGLPGVKGSLQFIETSFVKVPAFSSAHLYGQLKPVEAGIGWPLKAIVPTKRFKEAAKD